MTGLAGWGVTTVVCRQGHGVTAVARQADGSLFTPGIDLAAAMPQSVRCLRCDRSYRLDTVALMRDVRAGKTNFRLR